MTTPTATPSPATPAHWKDTSLGRMVSDSGHTPSSLARELGQGYMSIWQMLSGKRTPSLRTALRIARIVRAKPLDFLAALDELVALADAE